MPGLSDLIWGPWVQIVCGGLGMVWGWSGVNHLRTRGARARFDGLTAWGLLITGVSLVVIGLVRTVA